MSFNKTLPFLAWLPLVKTTWKDDLVAGLTGTIIVIPQAVALALIAGLPPIYGFYTAIISTIIASLFGSSNHLISGPTTTSSIMLYAIISNFHDSETQLEAFISLAIVLTAMSGLIKLFMGIAKMGKLVNFVSYSVIVGFTAGAGVLISFKQLKHVFGLQVPQGSSFYEILVYFIKHIELINWYVFLVAVGTLILAVVIKKYVKKISKLYLLLAMIFGTGLTFWLGGNANGIQTLGQIPSGLPSFNIPDFSIDKIRMLSSGAVILALLGLVEAVSISKSIALQSHQNLNSNQEFISQGLSNFISSFFSCYASSGSFTRSNINYQVGAKTPFSGIVSGIGLLIVLLLFAKYAAFLPKAVMGGIIMLVGYNLIDFQQIRKIIKSSKREILILAVTFFGTLFLALETALFTGILISLFFYLEKTSKPNIAIFGKNKENKFINIIRDDSTRECPQLKMIRIDGSIYFGAVEVISKYFVELYEQTDKKHLLIMANGVNFIDLAGAEWLANEALKWQKRGGGIYFSGLKLVSQDILIKGEFIDKIGKHNFFKDKNSAIDKIFKSLDTSICANCDIKIFTECEST
jgi:SulP family sulfate permease